MLRVLGITDPQVRESWKFAGVHAWSVNIKPSNGHVDTLAKTLAHL